MAVECKVFGKSKEGQDIFLYTISNSNGVRASVTNLGAILVSLMVPDKNGNITDVVLGFDKAEDYYDNDSFFGTVIGPSANRIGGAQFTIDGVTYHIDDNDGGNNLHSHKVEGYHKRLWQTEIGDNSVTFSLEDEDGSMGFPGNKRLQVTYSLDEDNSLKLHYHGSSDKRTVLNLTNHTYFNLDGHGSGNVLEHTLWMNALYYTPVVAGAIPTGEIAPVAGTPMDFIEPKTVGQDIEADFEQLKLTGGYDHNWVINGSDGSLKLFAEVQAPKSGRSMKAYTTLPGVQFYAGNFIAPQQGKEGVTYGKRFGLCLETQFFPNSVNQPNFPDCVFGGDREYDSVTVYQFEV